MTVITRINSFTRNSYLIINYFTKTLWLNSFIFSSKCNGILTNRFPVIKLTVNNKKHTALQTQRQAKPKLHHRTVNQLWHNCAKHNVCRRKWCSGHFPVPLVLFSLNYYELWLGYLHPQCCLYYICIHTVISNLAGLLALC